MIALYDLCILGELRLGMVAASHFLFQVTSTYLQKNKIQYAKVMKVY